MMNLPIRLRVFFAMLNVNSIAHPFIRPKETAPLGVIAITSDKGLLGGLNNRVMNVALDYIKDFS